MIILRNCLERYAYHIDALNDKAPKMVRFLYDDAQETPTVGQEHLNEDKLLIEREIEMLGPLAYQQDPAKKLLALYLDIEKVAKDEC